MAWPEPAPARSVDAEVSAAADLAADPGSEQRIAADGTADEAGFALPPPWGTAPRLRPVQTLWLIDEAAWELAADTIRDEGMVVVDYLATYAMAGDGPAVGLRAPRRVLSASEQLTASLTSPVLAPSEPPSRARVQQMFEPFPDDHRAVVVTTRPSTWEHLRGDVPAPAPPDEVAASLPRSSTYVIELSPAAGDHEPERLVARLPAAVAVDPDRAGHLAHALARAWVESYRGGWDATRNAPRGGRP